MNKYFRYIITFLLGGILLFSCFKKTSKKEVEENLKTAMGLYLNHQPKIDSSRVKFNVLEVVYFEDKTDYICEFKVNMKEKHDTILKDTTGSMSANISKDFKTVSRRY